MKKIIYSLVIMIAAGSLFTSCIEQVEPVGLLDMRTAKAEYIRALKDLRAADATYRRAQADVEQAKAALIQAKAAYQASLTAEQEVINEYKRLLNEAQEMKNEYDAAVYEAKIAELEMQIAEKRAKHEVTMVKCETALAQAQETLRTVLRDIAIAAKSLSPNEKLAVAEAAALYYALIQQEITVQHAVDSLQITVDTLVEYKLRFADTAWSRGKLVGVVEKYENDIAWYEAMIALDVIAAAAVPDTSAALEEWKEALDAAGQVAQEIKVKKAQQAFDSTGYVEAVINPGVARFNAAIAEFILANWEKDTTEAGKYVSPEQYSEPKWTTADQDAYHNGVAPKQEDYTKTTGHAPYDTIGSDKKEVVFNDLYGLEKTQPWFMKYAFMLTNGPKSYSQTNSFAKAEPKPTFMSVIEGTATTSDTLRINPKILTKMEKFILGDSEGSGYQQLSFGVGADEITVNYGLWGAYEILNRVYTQATNIVKDSADYFKEKARLADSTWTSQHDTLKNGLTSFSKYTAAIDAFEAAVADVNAKNQEMADAIANFKTAWADAVATGAQWNEADSISVIAAIQRFAQAREAYLEGWKDSTAKKYGKHENPAYLYYVSSGNPFTVDSVLISALDFNAIRTKTNVTVGGSKQWSKYEVIAVNEATETYTAKTYADAHTGYVEDNRINEHGVFDVIISQMMGAVASDKTTQTVQVGSDKYYQWKDVTDWVSFFNDGVNYRPLLGAWKYTAAGEVKTVFDNSEVYHKKVTDAEKAVKSAVAEYVAIYNEYWGQNLEIDETLYDVYFTAVINEDDDADTKLKEAENDINFDPDLMEDGKLKSDSYVLSVFDKQGDGTPLVWFTPDYEDREFKVENSVLDTLQPGFLALLASVDPKCTTPSDNHFFGGQENNKAKSAIFYGADTVNPKQTTAYKALYWKYMYWVSENAESFGNDLAKIKSWIEGVAAKFAEAKKDTRKTEPDVEAYNNAVIAFNKAKAKKPVVDNYLAAKKEFVGTHVERIAGKDSAVLNDILVKVKTIQSPNANLKNPNFYKITTAADVQGLFTNNLIGEIVGWDETILGGTQLENANEFFGEDYPEMIQEMRVNLRKWENQEADAAKFADLYEDVVMAKAELEGYTAAGTTGAGEETLEGLYAKYKASYEKLIKAYADDIVEYRKKIDAAKHYIAAYKSEVPDFDGLIAAAEEDLKHAQAALKAIQKAKEQAKINLDKIMEYISSTDAEFVIPVTVQDMQMMINNLSAVLDEFDIDIEKLLAGYLIEAGIIADPDVDADGDGD